MDGKALEVSWAGFWETLEELDLDLRTDYVVRMATWKARGAGTTLNKWKASRGFWLRESFGKKGWGVGWNLATIGCAIIGDWNDFEH